VAAELVACPKCSRNNNPLRQNCIYCGEPLPIIQELSADMVAARSSRAQENQSKSELDPLSQISTQLQQSLLGFSVIMLPSSERPDKAVEAITSMTGFNEEEARQLLELSYPMPLARFQHELEAKAISERLETTGLLTIVVSDEKLQPGTPNRRAKRLSIEGDTIRVLTDSNRELSQPIPRAEIKLIVEGKIRQRQLHTTEQNTRFGKQERELTDALEFVDEKPIMDIYTLSPDTGFRVRAESFDYSGLGSKMKLTAIENFRMLAAILRDAAPSAVYDSDFKNCTKLLEMVWPSTSRNESKGLRRAQLLTAGRIATRSMQHIDNEMQFNRYSRLRYHLMDSKDR
jgi:hypothetical protein